MGCRVSYDNQQKISRNIGREFDPMDEVSVPISSDVIIYHKYTVKTDFYVVFLYSDLWSWQRHSDN